PRELASAARALRNEADSVEAFALAARGLAFSGATAESNQTIDAALKRHPTDATLLITGAELRLAGGDLPGARVMLARAGKTAVLTLAERQRAEELLAEVSDRAGDVE